MTTHITAQQRITFLGLPLNIGYSVDDICAMLEQRGQGRLVTFVDASAWALAEKNPDYLGQLEKMSLVLPATRDVACACCKITGETTTAISFEPQSLPSQFFNAAIKNNNSVMLVGGQPSVDERTHDKLQLNFAGLNIISSANGYGDIAPKIALVLEKNPDVVLVDYPTPRGEAFLIALHDAGYKGLAIVCDGFFDDYLHFDDFYPAWVKQYHLYFAYRLISEANKRLGNFARDYVRFAIPAIKALLQKHLPKKLFGQKTSD